MHHKLIATSYSPSYSVLAKPNPASVTSILLSSFVLLNLVKTTAAEADLVPSDPMYCEPEWANITNTGYANFWSVVGPYLHQGYLNSDIECASDLFEAVCKAVIASNIPTCITPDCVNYESLITQPNNQQPLSLDGYKNVIFNQTFLIANQSHCASIEPSLTSIYDICKNIDTNLLLFISIIGAGIGGLTCLICIIGGIMDFCKKKKDPEAAPLLGAAAPQVPIHAPENPAPPEDPMMPTLSMTTLNISDSGSEGPETFIDETLPLDPDQKAI